MAAVRNAYTSRDERLMWEFLFERLQAGDEAAYQPKGLKLWKSFAATEKTNKTSSSLASHFRKTMFDHIEDAKLPVEQQLYIASQLSIQLSRRQRRIIECNSNVSITTNDFGIVTAYQKEGKRYLPSLLKRTFCEDNVIDGQDSDPFELERSSSKALSATNRTPGSPPYCRRYNLRGRPSDEETVPSRSKRAKGTEAILDGHRNMDENAELHAGQVMLDDAFTQENGSTQNTEREDDAYRRCSCLNEIIRNSNVGGNNEIAVEKNGLREKLRRSNFVMVHSETDVTAPEDPKQLGCSKATDPDFDDAAREAVEQKMESFSGKETFAPSDQIETGKALNKISRNVAAGSCKAMLSTSSPYRKKMVTYHDAIEDELRQLLARIESKSGVRDVEKMKGEAVLRVRAEECKRLGVGLKRYLKNIRQKITETENDSCSVTAT